MIRLTKIHGTVRATRNTSGANVSHRLRGPAVRRRYSAYPKAAPTTAPGAITSPNGPYQVKVLPPGPAIWIIQPRRLAAQAVPHAIPVVTSGQAGPGR
ncbi:MAG TPA: hypothetical protein VHN80_17235 [Kineosporiaceae bacterium]|nr:hypothetical protein [Kineosporiaceae bacterium]